MNALRALIMGVVLLVLSVSLVAQDPFSIKDPYPGDSYTSNGVAWGDWDGDGYQDVFITNGAYYQPYSYYHEDFLYRNKGDGTFEKITTGAIVTDQRMSGGGNWGDFDNSGDLDLYVTATDAKVSGADLKNSLYVNNSNGTFTKNTSAGPPVDDAEYSCAAGWGDYDNDGYLDLFVKNGWQGQKKNHALYRNNGDNTFTKIDAGDMTGSNGAAFISGFAACDFDMDGDLDIFVCSGGLAENKLWRNNGNNVFVAVGSFPGNFSNGCSWADIDNDGDFDLFIANYGDSEKVVNDLYINNGNGTFTKNTSSILAIEPSWSMGSAFGDIDNDGDLDLFVANDYQYDTNPNFLYINDGHGNFTKNTTSVAVSDPMSQSPHGVAFADYDNNGFLDLFAAVHGPNFFLENNAPNNGNTNSWILINLEGTISTKTPIGAKVWATATINGTQVTQLRQVASQTGMASNNSYRVHFGFGDATVISELKVEFQPVSLAKTNTIMTYSNVQTNQIITITEGTPIAVELISFIGALLDDDTVNLAWTTANEINNAGFFVQKSMAPNSGFTRINEHLIVSQGDAACGSCYSFQDQLRDAQAAFYRIENISFDGVSTLSNIISVSRTSDAQHPAVRPAEFFLAQNYPNPFNATTTIAYELAAPSTVKLVIYDGAGQHVKTLDAGVKTAGSYRVLWNGHDDTGQRVASGVYLYKMNTETGSVTRKMMVLQ